MIRLKHLSWFVVIGVGLAGSTSTFGGHPAPDEIRLIDGSLVDGRVISRVANAIVVERSDGSKELLDPRLIKEVRLTGSVAWISLREALGETEASGTPDRSDPSAPARGRDGSSTTRDLGEERLPSGRLKIIHIDMEVNPRSIEQRSLLESAWPDADFERYQCWAIHIDDVGITADMVRWLSTRARRIPASAQCLLVLGNTDNRALMLAGAVDSMCIREDAQMRFGVMPEGDLSEIVMGGFGRVSGDTLTSICRGRGVRMGPDGALEISQNRVLKAMDSGAVVRSGLAVASVPAASARGLGSVLRKDRAWASDEARLSRLQARVEREAAEGARRIEVAQSYRAGVSSAAAELRSSASAFDRLYERHKIRNIWKRDANWENRVDEIESVRAQKAVRGAMSRLKSQVTGLERTLRALPDDHQSRLELEGCLEAGKRWLERLVEYEKGIQRNAADAYERTRSIAKELRIGEC